MYKLLEPGTVVRPGDIFLVEIALILRAWVSGDGGGPGPAWDGKTGWEVTLEEKRDDDYYEQVVDSIRTLGFVKPVTGRVTEEGELRFSDGHHRLAAAIDLGMTHIPVEFYNEYANSVSGDCYYWIKSGVVKPNPTQRVTTPIHIIP